MREGATVVSRGKPVIYQGTILWRPCFFLLVDSVLESALEAFFLAEAFAPVLAAGDGTA